MIHCGSGNADRPRRWSTINRIFFNLATSLNQLGHEVAMMIHPAAKVEHPDNPDVLIKYSANVDVLFIKQWQADVGITWNGNSEGDRIFSEYIGEDYMIYGELGFFGHYDNTCYFDNCGVNTRHSLIGAKLVPAEDDGAICGMLQQEYIKPRMFDKPFVFVPLQDETDTQIDQYSPFKTMDSFLHHVFDVFRHSEQYILYKVHPKAPAPITLTHERVIEVKDDVHHYLPYADFVFGLNSTVMMETLLYHNRIIPYGCGVTSRHFADDKERQAFVAEMYRRQMKWDSLLDVTAVENSYFYEILTSLPQRM
jgi:hypothetical protein